MEFLLLLSAFLSALTGAITGVRSADLRPGQAVVASSTVRAVQPVAVAVAIERPAAADMSLSKHRDAGTSTAFAIVAAVPLYVSRLRV
jgi:hypothetical protein